MTRQRGKVKWFNTHKGYGFIARDNAPDVFVHYTSIEGCGFKNLREEEIVEFEVERTPQGWQALHVRKAVADTVQV